MEYPPPYKTSDVFNDTNQDSHVETILKFDESELLQYLRKAGDTMQGNLRAPELILYGESSRLTFHDGSYMTTASGAAANEQKLTDITYNSGTTTTTIANNTHINNLTANNINTSHLSGTTSNIQTQIDNTVTNTSTNTSNISALQTLTSQHTTDISQNTTNIATNTSEINSIKSVNTTQSTDITNIKTKTDKITITAAQDVNIKGTGDTIFQVGNINDNVGADDDVKTISVGQYTGGGVGVGAGYMPSALRGIAGPIISSFLVGARGDSDNEGLILSGDITRSSLSAGPHMFINRKGLTSIGVNCLTKYSEGFTLNVEGTTKLDGNITIPSGRTLNGISTTTLSYLDATSSIQTQLNNRLPLAGGTLSGALNMNNNNITNVNNIQLSTINGAPYTTNNVSGDLNPRFKATSNNGSTSYDIETGQYIKIGSTIHYTIDIKLSSKSGMSGDLYVECPEFVSSFPMITTPALNRYPVTIGYHSGFSDNKISSVTAYMDTTHKIFFWVSTFTAGSNSFAFNHLTQGNVDGSFRVTLQGYFYTTA